MPAAWTLYFASDNLEADQARAVALGAKIVYPPMVVGEFGGMAGLQDPAGAIFSLWRAGKHVGWEVDAEPGSVAWCELYSSNVKQARDFYAAFLGVKADPAPVDMEYYVLQHGEKQLGGMMSLDPAWGPMPSHWVPYFTVANADKTASLVAQNGGQVTEKVEDSPYGRMAGLRDPGGAVFKILQPPAG